MTNYGAIAPNDPCDVAVSGSMTNKQISHVVHRRYRPSQLSFFFSFAFIFPCFSLRSSVEDNRIQPDCSYTHISAHDLLSFDPAY